MNNDNQLYLISYKAGILVASLCRFVNYLVMHGFLSQIISYTVCNKVGRVCVYWIHLVRYKTLLSLY
jgi:hypothetical protein